MVIALPLALVVAHLFFVVVEGPARRFSRSVARGRATAVKPILAD
jgi:hypothetical protein